MKQNFPKKSFFFVKIKIANDLKKIQLDEFIVQVTITMCRQMMMAYLKILSEWVFKTYV